MARFQSTWKKTILTALAIGAMVSLGVWQLDRLAWKTALIKKIQEQHEAAPMNGLPASTDYTDLEYRRVKLNGMVDDSKAIFLGPRTLNNLSGYYMLTPMYLPDKRVVLVNQGFIENAYMDRMGSTRMAFQSVTGTLRKPPAPGYFAPQNPATGNRYVWLDLLAIGTQLGLPNLLPVIVELDSAAARYSVDEKAYLSMPNNHLQYAITWFALAAIAAIFYLVSSFRGDTVIEAGFRQFNPNLQQGIPHRGPYGKSRSGDDDDDTPSLWS